MNTPKYGLDVSSNFKDTYKKGENFTVNGSCSRCGACCPHHLAVTKKEQQVIKAYIKQHNIRPVHHGEPMEDTASIDLVCPFLNDKGVVMSCTIYPVRPVICRIYKCDQTDEETTEKLDEEFKKGTVTLTDMSREINVDSTFFPEEYLPKPGDPVIINQLHMLEYIKHENSIFLMTNQKRFKNGKHEVFIQHIDDPKQNLWFDIQGLTKVEILKSKKEANP